MQNLKAMETYFWDNFDNDKEYSEEGITLKEACIVCLNEYNRTMEGDYHYARMNSDIERISDLMMGLPSPFYPEVYCYEIREYLKDWGIARDDKTAERMQNNWWRHWAKFILDNAKGK